MANRSGQLAAVAALDEQLELARAGGGPKYAERHATRGRLLARERIELLVDRDSPPLELSALAAWGTEFAVGASIVTCVGVVLSVRAAKRTAYLSFQRRLNEAFDEAERLWEPVYRSLDAQEGPAAFRDKRAPVWTGR